MTTDNKIALLKPLMAEIKLNNVPKEGFPVVVSKYEGMRRNDEIEARIKGVDGSIGTATVQNVGQDVFLLLEKSKLLEHAGKKVEIEYVVFAFDTGNPDLSEPTPFLISLG